MTDILVNAPLSRGRWLLVRDADWADAFQIKEGSDTETAVGRDITSDEIDLYIRPTYDHSVLIKYLSTDGGGGILKTEMDDGWCQIDLRQSDIEADIPSGEWYFFLRLREPDGVLHPWFIRELLRGPLIAYNGNVDLS